MVAISMTRNMKKRWLMVTVQVMKAEKTSSRT